MRDVLRGGALERREEEGQWSEKERGERERERERVREDGGHNGSKIEQRILIYRRVWGGKEEKEDWIDRMTKKKLISHPNEIVQ